MSENYTMDILGVLDQKRTQRQINSDIKQLEKVINALRITGTFARGDTKKELNAYIKQLSSQLSTVKLKAQIDSRNLKSEVNKALNGISFKEIDALNIDENKARLKVQKVIADTKAYAEKNSINIGINYENRRSKLDNDLTTYLNKNSKINESSMLLKEADRIRELIGAVTDKKSLNEATDAFQLFKAESSATGFATKSTTDHIKGMLSHITKIGSALGIASLALNNFVKSIKTLKTDDIILTEISKTSEMTRQQLKELGDEAFRTASKYGQLSSNYLLGVQEMARSGYEDMSKELGELSLLAQSAGDMTADSANNYLLATDAAYKYGGSIEKLNAALDGANYISNKNSASLTDIADATRVSASFAANAGVAIDELTAAEATMIATTKRSGSEIGRAFRSIILNLQQVSGEFDGEVIDEEQLKKVEATCHSLGVELEYMKDGVATLRNPMEVLKELAEVYNSLPDNSAEKQGLISDLGGKYHANALSGLLSRWDMYEKMLNEFSQGTGSALEEAEKTAQSWEGRLNSLSNSFTSFVNVLTNKDAVLGGISFFDRLIQGAEALTDSIGEIPMVLTTLNTAMTAMNKNYGITTLKNEETGEFDIQGNIFGIDFTSIKNQKKHFEEAGEAIVKWNSNLTVGKDNIDKFNNACAKNSTQLKAYLQTTSKEAPASLSGYKAFLNAAGESTDALRLKTVLLNSAVSFGLGVAIQLAVKGLSLLMDEFEKLSNGTEIALEKVEESIKEYKSATTDLQSVEEELDGIKSRIKELEALGTPSLSDEDELKRLQNESLELERQIALLKQRQLAAGRELMQDAKSAFNEKQRYGQHGYQSNQEAFTTALKEYEDYQDAVMQKQAEIDTFISEHNMTDSSDTEELNSYAKHQFDILQEQLSYAEKAFDEHKDMIEGAYEPSTKLIEAYDLIRENGGALTNAEEELYKQAKANQEAYLQYSYAIYGNVEAYKALSEEAQRTAASQKLVRQGLSDEQAASVVNALSKDDLDAFYTVDFTFAAPDPEDYATLEEYGRAYAETIRNSINRNLETSATETTSSLFNQLTTSQESLDKFQASIKSAADAYSTLLQGNYTSNELLSSIQAINQAAADMGGSLNWEFINGHADSLKLLGDTIKYISEQYANSVLNDMGIDTGSGFGQMLANIIQNAYESEAALAAVNTQIDSMQNAYNELNSIIETYNETGYLTFDQLQQVLEMEPEYLACLIDENGQLALNTEAMLALANQRLNEAEAQAVQQAITELGQLALQDEKTAVEENAQAFTNAVNDLANYNNELANTIAEATIGASAIRDLNGAISGAQAQGATDDQIETVLNNLNAKMQLIQETRSKLATSTLGNIMGGSGKQAKSSAKKTVDTYLEEFKKALEVLNKLGEQGKITEKQRLDQLRILYKRYFEDRKEYLKEYMEYEHEYLDGLNSLYRSAMSGIVSLLDKQADAYGDQKDAAVDSLKTEKEAAAEIYEQQIKNIEAQQKAIDVEIKNKKKIIDGIQQEIDKIKEAQQEREQEINLQKQKMALARAENQKTKKVYTEGGFIYEADTDAIKEARNAVKDAETAIEINNKQKQIDQIEREIGLLEERKTLLDEEKAAVQEMLDASNEKFDKMIEQTENYFDSLIDGINKYAEQWKELADMEEQAKMMSDIEELLALLGYSLDDVMNTSDEAFQAFKGSYLNLMSDIYAGNSQMLSSFSELSGVDMSTLNGYLAETEEYIGKLSALDLTNMGTALQSLSDNFGAVGDSIGGVANAISGGGASLDGEEKAGNGSGVEGSGTSLTGSMDELKSKADATLGTGGEDGSGTGMIGQFAQTEQKVTEVTAAIGNAEGGDVQAEGKAEGGGTLTSSITNLGETSNEVLGEPGGEGVIGKFGQMEEPILEANEHVTGISEGLAEIDGQEVECTIKVNIEQNGELPTHAKGTLGDMNLKDGKYTAKYGKAFAEGTGKYKGLAKAEKNALVSEYGQTEMTVLPNGKTIITDEPTMMDLPKDTVIFNEEQTKQIIDNKPQTTGDTFVDDTFSSKFIPYQPTERDLRIKEVLTQVDAWLFKGADTKKNISTGAEMMMEQMEKRMAEMTRNSTVNNIANNNKPNVHIGDIHVTCPGVTEQQVAERLGGVIGKELDKQFNGFHNYVDQMSRIR